jgi:ABC-type multidrug transport system ATPase subunit
MSINPVIEVTHLSKHFGNLTAVDDLSFTVPQGEVYGFLGQNGAGKSTTIRMLLTLVKPNSGSIRIFGEDLARQRSAILRKVGAIIERPDLYKYLTAMENLRIFSAMSGSRPSDRQLMEQLELVGLADRAQSKVKTYSQGMKQRLGIATALVHDPGLIILDEPTNGLDPQGIADVRNLILHLSRDRRKTVLISSHLLNEIELVADSMLIIDKGKKVVEGKVTDLFDPAATLMELNTTNDSDAFEKISASPLRDLLYEKTGDGLVLKLHRKDIPDVLRKLVEMEIGILSFHARHSLEDYFLSLTSAKLKV